jgi:valyl-tRNA synthetase
MILMTATPWELSHLRQYTSRHSRDAKGRKMSKSLNNGVDPLEIADKFGADAGRMALVVGNTPGTDMKWRRKELKPIKILPIGLEYI